MQVNVGSLFSGIGGIDLGLERAGMRVVWQCESNEFCSSVLARHWPDVPNYGDVRNIPGVKMLVPELICGGVPCQPTSQAAARTVRGEEWLWPEMFRIVRAFAPRFVILENPEGLRYAGRGLGVILDDLSALGFSVEWRVVRASDFGAPHKRARVWLVAHADRDWKPALAVDDEAPLLREPAPAFPEWAALPDLSLADGVPERLAVSAYGNAAVPQIAEWIGRRILDNESERVAA